jgi:drug/metabolite transporter (DMT)-like permease
LVTAIFGFIVMGDRLTPLQWLGAVFVIGGVYLSMLQKSTEQIANSRQQS